MEEEDYSDYCLHSVDKRRVNKETKSREYLITWKPSSDSLDESSWWQSWEEEVWLEENCPEALTLYEKQHTKPQKRKVVLQLKSPLPEPARPQTVCKYRDLHKLQPLDEKFIHHYVLSCHGSFNPPHKNHFRMLEEAKKALENSQGGGICEVVGGFFLPSSSLAAENKLGSAALPGPMRVKMLRSVLASHPIFGVDGWLADQPGNPGAARAVRELEAILETHYAGRVQLVQVCGGDLLPKLHNMFSRKKPVVCIIDRPLDFDVDAFVEQKKLQFGATIHLQKVEGKPMSSTKVRNAWRAKDLKLLKELIPSQIIEFHEKNRIDYGVEDGGRYSTTHKNTTIQNDRDKNQSENEIYFDEILSLLRKSGIPEIDNVELMSASSLGRGITGEVFMGEINGEEVACKSVSVAGKPDRIAKQLVVTVKNECDAALRLGHHDLTHLVPLRSFSLFSSSEILTVMPLYQCSLRMHLDSPKARVLQPHTYFPSSFSHLVLLHIAKGMAVLHSAGILHRDLVPSNVLLDFESDGETLRKAAVCDFGLSIHKSIPVSTVLRGSLLHYAPESVASKGVYHEASDVFMWSYIAVEMASCGKLVWDGMTKQDAMAATRSGQRPRAQAGIRSPWFEELQETAWHQDHTKRTTFEEISDTLARALFS